MSALRGEAPASPGTKPANGWGELFARVSTLEEGPPALLSRIHAAAFSARSAMFGFGGVQHEQLGAAAAAAAAAAAGAKAYAFDHSEALLPAPAPAASFGARDGLAASLARYTRECRRLRSQGLMTDGVALSEAPGGGAAAGGKAGSSFSQQIQQQEWLVGLEGSNSGVDVAAFRGLRRLYQNVAAEARSAAEASQQQLFAAIDMERDLKCWATTKAALMQQLALPSTAADSLASGGGGSTLPRLPSTATRPQGFSSPPQTLQPHPLLTEPEQRILHALPAALGQLQRQEREGWELGLAVQQLPAAAAAAAAAAAVELELPSAAAAHLGAGAFLPPGYCSFAAAASAAIAAAAADPSAAAQQQQQPHHKEESAWIRDFGEYPPMLPFVCRQLVVLLQQTSLQAVQRNCEDKEGQRAADALRALVAALPDAAALSPAATTARGWSDCCVLHPPQQQLQGEGGVQQDNAQRTDPHLLLMLSLLRPDIWPPLKLSETLQQVTQEDFLHYRLLLLLVQEKQQSSQSEAHLLRGLRALVSKVKLQGPLFFDPQQQQLLLQTGAVSAAADGGMQQQQEGAWADPQRRISASLHRVAMVLLLLCNKFGCFESAALLHLSSDALHEAAEAACGAAALHRGGFVAESLGQGAATGGSLWGDEVWALERQERGSPSEGSVAEFLAQDLAASINSTFGCTDSSSAHVAGRLVFAAEPPAGFASGELDGVRSRLKAVLLSAMDEGLKGTDPLAKLVTLSQLPLFWSVPLLPAVLRDAFGAITKPGVLLEDSDATEGDLPPGLLEALLLRLDEEEIFAAQSPPHVEPNHQRLELRAFFLRAFNVLKVCCYPPSFPLPCAPQPQCASQCIGGREGFEKYGLPRAVDTVRFEFRVGMSMCAEEQRKSSSAVGCARCPVLPWWHSGIVQTATRQPRGDRCLFRCLSRHAAGCWYIGRPGVPLAAASGTRVSGKALPVFEARLCSLTGGADSLAWGLQNEQCLTSAHIEPVVIDVAVLEGNLETCGSAVMQG
ncbi:uncharacterized protein LOC34618712 [Cyclospora cayetanensis]|uniref:Uncharacterized protein LOC34618712 n=1 Tax=Cyclospora cayetanensis TaxID=88456 RepID=A0A6P6RUX5_9EIME|nr:uncharacterized protein LOC34618712 [Cyclospora cayetanensis]